MPFGDVLPWDDKSQWKFVNTKEKRKRIHFRLILIEKDAHNPSNHLHADILRICTIRVKCYTSLLRTSKSHFIYNFLNLIFIVFKHSTVVLVTLSTKFRFFHCFTQAQVATNK